MIWIIFVIWVVFAFTCAILDNIFDNYIFGILLLLSFVAIFYVPFFPIIF